MSQTRLELFSSICGGDRKAGGSDSTSSRSPAHFAAFQGELLYPLFMSDQAKFKQIDELTYGWVHLIEAFCMLFSGDAPTAVASREGVIRSPSQLLTL